MVMLSGPFRARPIVLLVAILLVGVIFLQVPTSQKLRAEQHNEDREVAERSTAKHVTTATTAHSHAHAHATSQPKTQPPRTTEPAVRKLFPEQDNDSGLQALEKAIVKYSEQMALTKPQNKKFVLYRCAPGRLCGGLGDRLYGVITAFFLALSSNRALMIDWENPVSLNNYMMPLTIDWRLNQSLVDSSSTSLHFVDNYPPSVTSANWLQQRENVIICEGNLLLMNPFKRNSFIMKIWKDLGIQDVTVHNLARGAMRALFQPSETITNIINEFKTNYPSSEFYRIGVQIRSGDQTAWSDPQRVHPDGISCFVDRAMSFFNGRAKGKKGIIFLSTDSDNFAQNFRLMLARDHPEILLVTMDSYPRTHLDRTKSHDGDASKFTGTFLDWFLLAEMDIRVLSRSNFAYTSSLMAPTGRLDVLYDGNVPKDCLFLDFSINDIATR